MSQGACHTDPVWPVFSELELLFSENFPVGFIQEGKLAHPVAEDILFCRDSLKARRKYQQSFFFRTSKNEGYELLQQDSKGSIDFYQLMSPDQG